MKLRIKGNSVRYRLSQSEVAQFNQNEYIDMVSKQKSKKQTKKLT